ncbi:DUF3265 domain-containing protein [Vibrio coralliilyticus]|nr:DUF3265 domain-containing protein [Vibrio coralliilyticus]NOI50116.1 DUF3265 domain-containing protein [Vibrio coralliilyticus]
MAVLSCVEFEIKVVCGGIGIALLTPLVGSVQGTKTLCTNKLKLTKY